MGPKDKKRNGWVKSNQRRHIPSMDVSDSENFLWERTYLQGEKRKTITKQRGLLES